MCMFARGLIGGLLLLLAGCAVTHPDVPAAALSQRILPPPGQAMPPAQMPAPVESPVE
jgi:hypothetical protein